MDPLTLIVTAVAAGALAAFKSVGEEAVKDAYKGLKGLILEKYGKKKDVAKAVKELEAEPKSDGYKTVLKEKLAGTGADKDEKLIQAAQALLAKADPKGTKAGQYIVITGDGNVIGDHSTSTVIKQQAGDGAVQIGQAGDVTLGSGKPGAKRKR